MLQFYRSMDKPFGLSVCLSVCLGLPVGFCLEQVRNYGSETKPLEKYSIFEIPPLNLAILWLQCSMMYSPCWFIPTAGISNVNVYLLFIISLFSSPSFYSDLTAGADTNYRVNHWITGLSRGTKCNVLV